MIEIMKSWKLIKDSEEAFAEFLPRLESGDGKYRFCVRQSPDHHQLHHLWIDRLDFDEGSQIFTKGVALHWDDLRLCEEYRAAAALVIEELRRRPWRAVGLYKCSPDPELFELPELEEV